MNGGINYGQILGGLANLGLGLAGGFGSKPQVARFTPLNLSNEQKKAITGNITNFDDISKLGDLYTQYLLGEQNALLPGFSSTLASGEKGAAQLLSQGESLLTGNIPQDVLDQVARASAYQSLEGGYGGQMASNNLARNLGLTSLDLMQEGARMIGQGGDAATRWASLANADIYNPSNMFVNPEFQAGFDLQNQILKQQSLQNVYNVAAAPDPMLLGIMGQISQATGSPTGTGGGSFGGGFNVGGQSSITSLLQQILQNQQNQPVDWLGSATGGSSAFAGV